MIIQGKQKILCALVRSFVVTLMILLLSGITTFAQNGSAYFLPGNLVLSRSVYVDTNSITAGVTVLPPNCSPANCPTPVTAVVGSAYPFVFNNANAKVDGSFGITSKIFLDQMTPSGTLVNSLEVANSSQNGVPPSKDQMVTSFSSKSEMALNVSTDGGFLTLMGYLAPIGAIDVSNSNTPGEVDPTNPVGETVYRVVAQVDQKGKFRYTLTNAYSGNNGRAAILNAGANVIYTSGNAGNGGNPQPDGIILGAGAQIMTPEKKAAIAQSPGIPTPVGSFNITQLALPPDKIGKDTNFRGLTIYNNVLYFTKGSGGNGINTVYFLDTTGQPCTMSAAVGTPPHGVGLPSASATLPTSGIDYDLNQLQTKGVFPYNMCILKGFSTVLANTTGGVGVNFPFGVWFANPTTMYVADEGTGKTGKTATGPNYTDFYLPATPAKNPTAGLQKWVFNSVLGEWQLAYTLINGLQLGVPYSVPNSSGGDVYPTGLNNGTGGTGFPWAPANDGLRNITGIVNGDGTVTIYAVTSTISGSGDQGADPNQLVKITDTLNATSPSAGESFTTVRKATFGEVLRGISLTPVSPK